MGQMAGLPVLLRLPDLAEGSASRRSTSRESAVRSEAEKTPPPHVDRKPQGGAAEHPTGAKSEANAQAGTQSTPAKPAWRNFTWQLLILILLPVLFLAAWYILSSPNRDSTETKADDGVAAPEIELGEPVPPEAIVSPAMPPDSAQAESTSPTTSPSDHVPESKWSNGGGMTEANSTSVDGGTTFDSTGRSAQLQAKAPPTVDGGPSAAIPANGSGGNGGSSPARAPQPDYPSTDPSTFHYPSTANDRVGQMPSAGGFSYPSTGAPPAFGESPGSASGGFPR
jgi:hypothetical protein